MAKKVRVVSLAHDTPIGPLHFYQTLSKYVEGIKVTERTIFWLQVNSYITKKVIVVSPAQDTPTGPPLHFCQISYYLKQYGSYSLHKISASGEINT